MDWGIKIIPPIKYGMRLERSKGLLYYGFQFAFFYKQTLGIMNSISWNPYLTHKGSKQTGPKWYLYVSFNDIHKMLL